MLKKGNKQFVLVLLFMVLNLYGCAAIKEGARGFFGISTKVLEEGRKEAFSKSFNYGYADCFEKTKQVLLEKYSYIYAGDLKQRMLAVYVSAEDTTPVGIFFKEVDANNTLIEVSSPSTNAKEKISKRVFDRILGLDKLEKEKENQEEKGVSSAGKKSKLF